MSCADPERFNIPATLRTEMWQRWPREGGPESIQRRSSRQRSPLLLWPRTHPSWGDRPISRPGSRRSPWRRTHVSRARPTMCCGGGLKGPHELELGERRTDGARPGALTLQPPRPRRQRSRRAAHALDCSEPQPEVGGVKTHRRPVHHSIQPFAERDPPRHARLGGGRAECDEPPATPGRG